MDANESVSDLRNAEKVCSQCKQTKPLSSFRKNVTTADGRHRKCRECDCAHRRQKYRENPETNRAKNREYYRKNRTLLATNARASYQRRRKRALAQKADYRKKNHAKIVEGRRVFWRRHRERLLAKIRAYSSANREKLNAAKRAARLADPERQREISARYRLKHPEKIARRQRDLYQKNKQQRLEWERRYRRNNINRKISVSLRNRLNAVLRGNVKTSSVLVLLGCSVEEFKAYFESRFTEDMTWQRFLAGEIHIDHLRPCRDFDLSKAEGQKSCFHYSNLQPLWARDNLRKGSKRLIEHKW